MAKVAIENENITSFGGIYHIMDVFSKLGFEKLTESVLGKRGSSGKAFCYGSIFCGFLYFPIGLGGGFYAYARTKNSRKSPYQWINPKNVTSIYKSTKYKDNKNMGLHTFIGQYLFFVNKIHALCKPFPPI